MNEQDFDVILGDLETASDDILHKRKYAYAKTEDRLWNFHIIAQASGLSPLQVWLVYFMKHALAVANYVNSGHTAEGPESNFIDLFNYVKLGYALLREERDELSI
jgi:hypothetical protein